MSDKKKEKDIVKAVYLQYDGQEISLEEIERLVKENYDSVKKGTDDPSDIKIYLKPDDFAGEIDLLPEVSS